MMDMRYDNMDDISVQSYILHIVPKLKWEQVHPILLQI
jgi:hypothetical protein